MKSDSPEEITALLVALGGGDDQAESRLLTKVYDELRGLARREMNRRGSDLTIEPTGLVHEVFMKMMGSEGSAFEHRRHFFEVAAKAMRRLIVDHHRSRQRLKRGGDHRRIPLDQVGPDLYSEGEKLLAMDEALSALGQEMPEAARIVELRFFGGLEVAETARLLEVSESTVKRQWRFARAWLIDFINAS